MNTNIKIENEVPFGHLLYTKLYLSDSCLDTLVRHDQMETHYLAWETVRKQRNPFFQKGTGFEGYLIGQAVNAEAALDAILTVNQQILDAIARLYRFQSSFRSRLMKTLTKEAGDSASIHIWSAYLGAELGKLRAQMRTNSQAQAYRQQTYQLISGLPPMSFRMVEGDVTQMYTIGAGDDIRVARLLITPQALKPDQQDAWLVAENIGEFGHPLVRKLLDHGECSRYL